MTSHSGYIHDRPAKEDSLGRSHFAKALSHSLILPKDSSGLVVGIEGSWGSGIEYANRFHYKKPW